MENYAWCLRKIGEYKKALFMVSQAQSKAFKIDDLERQRDLFYLESKIYFDLDQLGEALISHQKATSLADSIQDIEIKKELALLTIQFQIKQKNQLLKQNQLIAKQAQAQARISLLANVLLFLSLILTAAIFYIFYQQLKKRQALKEDNLRKQAEIEQNLLLDELRKREISSLTDLIEGQEIERQRIAAELHDGVGGTMAALKVMFSSIGRKMPEESPAQKSYKQALQLLNAAVNDIRSLSHQMSARPLAYASLEEAIRQLTDTLSHANSFQLDLDIEELKIIELQPEIELHLYRIIQEHFQNIIKHAQAKHVSLSIKKKNHLLEMSFIDDGQGFIYHPGDKLPGMGLQSIQQRVKQMEASWDLQSHPRRGTQSYISIPLKPNFQQVDN
ncbi:MAG: histidine kinase [Bacteroidota bacterium]